MTPESVLGVSWFRGGVVEEVTFTLGRKSQVKQLGKDPQESYSKVPGRKHPGSWCGHSKEDVQEMQAKRAENRAVGSYWILSQEQWVASEPRVLSRKLLCLDVYSSFWLLGGRGLEEAGRGSTGAVGRLQGGSGRGGGGRLVQLSGK